MSADAVAGAEPAPLPAVGSVVGRDVELLSVDVVVGAAEVEPPPHAVTTH